MPTSIYDFEALQMNGQSVPLSQYRGKVLLIVNTASRCGFTPQYAGLQALHETYGSRGLVVIGFPCNQFGAQEPEGEAIIAGFCTRNYGVDFLLTEKVNVNGPDAHPVFAYLTAALPGVLGSRAIKWNFTKFLIDREGNIVKRFEPTKEPAAIVADIEALL